MPASHVDLLCAASVSHKSPIDPRRWLAIKILYGHQYTLPRPPVLESVAIKYQCAAAGAREATDEGITGETDSDSRDYSSNVGVPTDDGAGEALIGERTKGDGGADIRDNGCSSSVFEGSSNGLDLMSRTV
nr:hypothetical protein [Tanacetum cinerariifolium]